MSYAASSGLPSRLLAVFKCRSPVRAEEAFPFQELVLRILVRKGFVGNGTFRKAQSGGQPSVTS